MEFHSPRAHVAARLDRSIERVACSGEGVDFERRWMRRMDEARLPGDEGGPGPTMPVTCGDHEKR